MIAVNLTVDVHCIRPDWVFYPANKEYLTPTYRIYINGDLLTERTWVWENNFIVREEIWIHAIQHRLYTITLESVLNNPAQATFILDNLLLTRLHQQEIVNQNTLSFALV